MVRAGTVVSHLLQREWVVIALLGLWGLFMFYWNLDTPLRSDEGLYAAIARRIFRTGEWFPLVYEGRPYLNKPPLHFWQMVPLMSLWGQSEFAVRFPSATFGIATMFLAYVSGRVLFHRRLGVIAALITSTTVSTVWQAHKAKFDIQLAFWINLAFLALYLAYRGEKRRWGPLALAFVSMAIGTMLKGPVALLLPGGAALAFLVVTRRWAAFREIPSVAVGMAIFLLMTGSYYQILSETFNRHFLMHENLMRLTCGAHPAPFYFYMIFADFFPWSLFLPGAAVFMWKSRSRPVCEGEVALGIWSIGFFVLLNVPAGKSERYLVPLIPPFALLMARYWDQRMRRVDAVPAPGDRLLRFTTAVLALLVLVTVLIGPWVIQLRYPIPSEFWPTSFVLVVAIACLVVMRAAFGYGPRTIFLGVAALAVATTVGLVQVFLPALDRYESARAINQEVTAVVGDAPLVIYHPDRPFGGDMIYYLDRPDPVPQLRTDEDVYAAFRSDGRVFGLLAKHRYEHLARRGDLRLNRLADYSYRRSHFVLVSNKGRSSPPVREGAPVIIPKPRMPDPCA